MYGVYIYHVVSSCWCIAFWQQRPPPTKGPTSAFGTWGIFVPPSESQLCSQRCVYNCWHSLCREPLTSRTSLQKLTRSIVAVDYAEEILSIYTFRFFSIVNLRILLLGRMTVQVQKYFQIAVTIMTIKWRNWETETGIAVDIV